MRAFTFRDTVRFGRIIMPMQNAKLALTILGFQIASFLVPLWLTLWLRSDCSGSLSWQCTSNYNPAHIPSLLFIILPVPLTKLVLKKVSWQRIIITYVVLAVILVALTWWYDPSNHPTGA